ncbi:MAG: hypothetical protein NO474_05510, partial [Methanomassiliicoccales archaeon]|nr:hypothetical protein [Methanomassiliicoccales archaeon]
IFDGIIMLLGCVMDPGNALRRVIHMLTPAFLVYYFLPDPLWIGGLEREHALLLLLSIILIAEALRLIFKPHIIGLRDYEQYQICAAVWAAVGMTIALLFFPLEYSAPVLMGMGWVDPLIGELRKRKSNFYPIAPLIVYFAIAFSSMIYLIGLTPPVFIAAFVATFLAVGIERVKSRFVDDDFLMIVVPLIGIAMTFALVK